MQPSGQVVVALRPPPRCSNHIVEQRLPHVREGCFDTNSHNVCRVTGLRFSTASWQCARCHSTNSDFQEVARSAQPQPQWAVTVSLPLALKGGGSLERRRQQCHWDECTVCSWQLSVTVPAGRQLQARLCRPVAVTLDVLSTCQLITAATLFVQL